MVNHNRQSAFTFLETLTVVAIIGVLAALLMPAFASARESARKAACSSNLRQIGLAMWMYMDDFGGRLPDRRDLKSSLPGGYRPWSGWPPSDPRCGWAADLLEPWVSRAHIWSCSAVKGRMATLPQVRQLTTGGPDTRYWMWRFDRRDDPVALDNVWGKTPDEAVADLRAAANPLIGIPEGPSQVELAVDPYFPRMAPVIPPDVRGLAVHFGGRNRLFLDGHMKYLRDGRTG